ncbi:MAG: hypothetical protein AB1439_06405, partial [candidate division FCPU426 bacterium]
RDDSTCAASSGISSTFPSTFTTFPLPGYASASNAHVRYGNTKVTVTMSEIARVTSRQLGKCQQRMGDS